MKEVSNLTLALVVVSAILISVVGTLMSLNKLDQLGGITGMAVSGTGVANLTVSSAAAITLNDALIELGTIGVLESNASDDKADWWVLENVGGVNVTVEAFASNQGSKDSQGAGPFSTDATTEGCYADTPYSCFRVKCLNTSDRINNGSIVGDLTNNLTSCNNTWVSLSTAQGEGVLMVNLPYWEGNDTIYLGVNVTVPPQETAGVKKKSVTNFAAIS